jgi:putative restriction endonuclease
MGIARAWSLMTLAGDRQYAGNRGYADEPRRTYKYDSNVANHKNVQSGHLVIVRDRSRVLGIARIEQILQQPGEKHISRCVVCGTTAIKERQNKEPRYRCNKGHEFAKPRFETAPVMLYDAHFENTYTDALDAVSIAQLKSAALRPSDQLSIEEIDIGVLERPLLAAVPTVESMLTDFYQSSIIEAGDGLNRQDSRAPGESPEFEGSLSDTREEILSAIRIRRGQSRFRNSLIARYAGTCVISGCRILDVLEAAHIWPYRGDVDNSPDNGLLLRADIHTLFDLNLIAINPESLLVFTAPVLASFGDYRDLDRVVLKLGSATRPALGPLRHRWRIFRDKWNFK